MVQTGTADKGGSDCAIATRILPSLALVLGAGLARSFNRLRC